MKKWSVAIADDNERMLEILDGIMKQDSDLEVVGLARNGEEACLLIKEKGPDIMLLDIIMPKIDGLSVMERIEQDPDIQKKPEFVICPCFEAQKTVEGPSCKRLPRFAQF